jgi:hypothetical protein
MDTVTFRPRPARPARPALRWPPELPTSVRQFFGGARGRRVPFESHAWTMWAYGWPAPALAVALVAGHGSRTAWLIAFFSLVLLWPATLATGRVAGRRAGAAAGVVCAALLVAPLVAPAPALRLDPLMLERRFDSPQQVARHTLRLPVHERAWAALWSARPESEAYLYFSVLSYNGYAGEPGLTVRLGDRPLGDLTMRTLAPGRGNDGTGDQAWHRLRVTRQELEAAPLLQVTVAPRGDAPVIPGETGLAGGYSFHPTDGPQASAFFDGERWRTEPTAVLAGLPPGATVPVRYYIELRILQSSTRRWIALYY